jgi:transposase-like protein
MPWKRMEVREQRVEFVVRALRNAEPLTKLCREFGISRPTGYLWLARYREGGVAGVEERSRRPRRSPTQTVPELEARIVALREA